MVATRSTWGVPGSPQNQPFDRCTWKRVAVDTRTMMNNHSPRIDLHSHRFDLDELMRLMAVVGFVALTTWVLTSSVGVLSGYLAVSSSATLRFLLAVLIVVFTRRTYWEIREWRWGKLPPDERFGFSNPLAEHGRASETGSQQPQA